MKNLEYDLNELQIELKRMDFIENYYAKRRREIEIIMDKYKYENHISTLPISQI